ncbi:MAG: hypothetical protein P4K93_05090 [Terracidiphilus sp.]|nr:hypothetical protein [Terracidiphilus sp.]MDR3797501.1 hypothetical protein [Terracidiphilus sp.]
MAGDFEVAFSELKRVFAGYLSRLAVKKDTATEYSLNTRVPSPFPQHKGHPMWFASVRKGKAYVSFHLMPLYMNPPLLRAVSPRLKKRMQGKTCFNLKAAPEPELLEDLRQLVEAAMNDWTAKKYV